ncbi:FixH family protein [Paracoccus tegillarcae]|uniref:Nitrogen fixation protein FixH n=1 Tax=Paracoccus tegillarcae TaxID=1529068 RepID=A0A2K9EIJ4_9RHOB|nr:FixH family protein [Paracoccus tegillarcae]AUH34818.1 nitrogen fixation protein FixH [Paracoccus tegillarcae]
MSGELRGYHVAMIFGSAVAIIIGVNLVLGTQAIRTFPGLEVKNSYVASQSFDRDRIAQQALGWQASVRVDGDMLRLDITGQGGLVRAEITEAKLGRASLAAQDRAPEFHPHGDTYLADVPGLAPGLWYLWFAAEAHDGTVFRQRLELRVPE